jgi:aromatic ring-cleaving dioxygenase
MCGSCRKPGLGATLLSEACVPYDGTMMQADPARIEGYHAHVYYDAESRAAAEQLRQQIAARFATAVLGRWHDEPVGPHPISMYQVAFSVEEFPRIVPFLMLNRAGLRILVHPETGNGYRDHAFHAAWLGEPVPLKLDVLSGER